MNELSFAPISSPEPTVDSITTLPTNIHGKILEFLDNIDCLVAAVLTHRCFNDAFRRQPIVVTITVLKRQVAHSLQPLAAATLEASHKKYTVEDIGEVDGLHIELSEYPEYFLKRLDPKLPQCLPIKDLFEIGDLHNFIGLLIDDYSSRAWQEFSGRKDPVNLSEQERYRFYHAFYYLELFLVVCKDEKMTISEFEGSRSQHFLGLLSSWEWVQLASVYRYLEIYMWTKIWVSHGLGFLMRLEKTTDPKIRKKLLASAMKGGSAVLDVHEKFLLAEKYHQMFRPFDQLSQEDADFFMDICNPFSYESPMSPSTIWAICHFCFVPKTWWADWKEGFKPARTAYDFWDVARIRNHYLMHPKVNPESEMISAMEI
ncbi:hypothetical protein GGS24DRAFT_502871 [Hypoxylon argillaceum]|nr:hypothetical protein GGS24DRAFT_502871 [Hypoxylon argillaceum]